MKTIRRFFSLVLLSVAIVSCGEKDPSDTGASNPATSTAAFEESRDSIRPYSKCPMQPNHDTWEDYQVTNVGANIMFHEFAYVYPSCSSLAHLKIPVTKLDSIMSLDSTNGLRMYFGINSDISDDCPILILVPTNKMRDNISGDKPYWQVYNNQEGLPILEAISAETAKGFVLKWHTEIKEKASFIPVFAYTYSDSIVDSVITNAKNASIDLKFAIHQVSNNDADAYCLQDAPAYEPSLAYYNVVGVIMHEQLLSDQSQYNVDLAAPCPKYCGHTLID